MFRQRERVSIKFDQKMGRTKQSFKDECDINKIMLKFQKTGAMTHFTKHSPTYGDATPIEYQDALNVVANANTMFEELPATIRDKFENDPTKFLEFVQDERNEAEMQELGLKPTPAPAIVQPGDLAEKQSEPASASPGQEKATGGSDGGQEG